MQGVLEPMVGTVVLRDRDETSLAAVLCLIFKLKRSEGQMLVQLVARDYSTKEELRIAASHDGQSITTGTTDAFMSSLRKKLAAHDAWITSVSKLGYGLDQKSRDKIQRLIAEYDAGLVSIKTRVTRAPP